MRPTWGIAAALSVTVPFLIPACSSGANDENGGVIIGLQTFITQDIQAVVVNPVDSTQATPAAKAAENAGIPLIAVDRSINGGKVAREVVCDNVQGGRLAAIE